MSAVERKDGQSLDPMIVETLMGVFNIHNEYVRTFKTAKDLAVENSLVDYAVCLFNNVPTVYMDLQLMVLWVVLLLVKTQ